MNMLKYSKIAALVVSLTLCSIAAQAQENYGLAEVEQKEVNCLAKNVYYEAGLESYEGRVAVAQVTVNRVEDGKFPTSICGVVHQKTRVPSGRTVCQFSWVCNPNRTRIRYDSDRWVDSLNAAKDVVLEGLRLDELDEALYFHNTHVRPNWGLERVARIGGHIFYSDDKVHAKPKSVTKITKKSHSKAKARHKAKRVKAHHRR